MSNTTLWIEWRLWQSRPTGYHVTNLLLHIAAAILLGTVLQRLAIPGAWFAALLYTVHPVNVESVAWIAQRKGLLAVVFFLVSVLWYLKAKEINSAKPHNALADATTPAHGSTGGIWYWLSLLAFLLALLSKGSVVVLPVVLLGLAWWRRRRITLADCASTVPFFLVAIALLAVNLWQQTAGFTTTIRTASLVERLLGAGNAIWFYLSKALLPIGQIFVYPQWRIQTHDLLWWAPIIAAVIVTLGLWRQGSSEPTSCGRSLLFAWGFFVTALLPVLGFVDVGFMRYSPVADHYQHLALIGVVTLVAAGFVRWQATGRQAEGAAPSIVAVALVAVLSLLTWQQAELYSGPIELYSTVLQQNPECSMAHYNLGNALFRSNQPQQAMLQYQSALRLDPNYSEAHANMGAALVGLGRPGEAINHYQQALAINPTNVDAVANMALAFAALHRSEDAIATAARAVEMARSQDEPLLADKVEAWLKSYRAAHGNRVEGPSTNDTSKAPDGRQACLGL